jgi:hypothetical protein
MSRRNLRRALVAASFALVAGCSHAHPKYPLGERDYNVDPSLTFTKIEFSVLVDTPQENLAVTFMALFDRRDEKIWSPLYTPFTQEDYMSFSAWPPDARIWEVKGRQQSVPTLYMSKSSRHLEKMGNLARYQLMEVRGLVRSAFEGRPWIEVLDLWPASNGGVYDDESIRRLIYGLEDAATAPASAIKNLDMALNGRLYTTARALAHTTLGDLYTARTSMNKEYWKDAWDHYDAAVHLDPSNKAARTGLDKARLQVDLLKREKEMKEPEQPEPPKEGQPK